MGSFEKLGILVIVVIIVMILAVAIYQWGGTGEETGPAEAGAVLAGPAPPLDVDFIDRRERKREAEKPASPPATEGTGDTWPGGVPRTYTMKDRDRVWTLVVRRWKLREEFVAAITAANPRLNMRDVKPGTEIRIPDPDAYRSGKSSAERKRFESVRTVRYEVQVGDTLELIARKHLGAKKHWRAILKSNPGLNPRRLMPGQEILLPVK